MCSLKRQNWSGSDEEPELASIWTPTVVESIAAHLPPNEVASVLRLIDKHAAHQLCDRDSVRLSQPVPRGIFAAHWQAPNACRDLPRAQRQQLLCLTASSGDVANLEVALAAAGLASSQSTSGLQEPDSLHVALDAAVKACQLDCCRLLAASLDLPLTRLAMQILPAAAERGDLALCQWAWEVCPGIQYCTQALCSAAKAGQRAVCEACLELLSYRSTVQSTDRPKAAAKAALSAAEGGHTDLLDWFLSLCPGPWDGPSDDFWEPEDSRVAGPEPLLLAAAKGCDAATLQRLWGQHGGAGGPLRPHAWGKVLRAAVASRTPDWAAKAEWALQQGAEANTRTCYEEAASLPDAVARFRWLRDRGMVLDLSQGSSRRAILQWAPVREVAAAGDVEAVEWLLGAGMVANPDLRELTSVARCAAGGAHIGVLQALRRAGYAVSPRDVADSAACAGHVPVLEWVRDTFEVDMSSLSGIPGSWQRAAALSGSVRVMAWLRVQGCEPQGDAWEGAVHGGSEAVLELLHEWGVPKPTDGQLYLDAAKERDLRTLRVLRRLGFSFGPRTEPSALFCEAARCCSLASLQCLVTLGCPVEWDLAERAVAEELEEMLQDHVDARVLPWIQEQRQR